jgi:aspartate aminotransferase
MAAKEAVSADPKVVEDMIAVFRKRRDLVHSLLLEIPGLKINLPEGAFYFFPDVSYYFGKSDGQNSIHNATDLCQYMLRKELVAVVTGDAFGDANCIRISYAASEDVLREALQRIKKALAQLH